MALGRRFESNNNRTKLQVLVDLNRLGHGLKNIGKNIACVFYFRIILRPEKYCY